MLFSYFITQLFLASSLGLDCDDIMCSNINDYVCGRVQSKGGDEIIMTYQNICHMRKQQCELKEIVDIQNIPGHFCDLQNEPMYSESDEVFDSMESNVGGRRVTDFSIVGAHQVCNHTCPTYCTDSYDPACAQIWKRNAESYSYRPMINHCHIDLFSCAAGLNVTIQPLGKCYKNPSGLLFMMQVAAMKSLKLLDDAPFRRRGTDEDSK